VLIAWLWNTTLESSEDKAAKNGILRKRGPRDGSDITMMPMPSSTTDQIAMSVVAPKQALAQ
jgi:hypothetical protein